MAAKPTIRSHHPVRKPAKRKHVGKSLLALAAKARSKAPQEAWNLLPKDWSDVDKHLYRRGKE